MDTCSTLLHQANEVCLVQDCVPWPLWKCDVSDLCSSVTFHGYTSKRFKLSVLLQEMPHKAGVSISTFSYGSCTQGGHGIGEPSLPLCSPLLCHVVLTVCSWSGYRDWAGPLEAGVSASWQQLLCGMAFLLWQNFLLQSSEVVLHSRRVCQGQQGRLNGCSGFAKPARQVNGCPEK